MMDLNPKDWQFYFKWISTVLIFASMIILMNYNEQFQVISFWSMVILIIGYFTKGGRKFYNGIISKFVK